MIDLNYFLLGNEKLIKIQKANLNKPEIAIYDTSVTSVYFMTREFTVLNCKISSN